MPAVRVWYQPSMKSKTAIPGLGLGREAASESGQTDSAISDEGSQQAGAPVVRSDGPACSALMRNSYGPCPLYSTWPQNNVRSG